MVTIKVEPEDEIVVLTKLKTVHAVLNRLGLHVTDALVIRGEELLTPDRELADGDDLIVRKVISVG